MLGDSHTDVSLPESLRNAKEVRAPLPVMLVDGKVVVWTDPSPDIRKLGFRRGDVGNQSFFANVAHGANGETPK